ncbi:MAG TPA: Fic family protein [bacterium]|nr:Fic family protein [bacterium]
MRGELVRKVWPANLNLNAPVQYRRACEYATFIPFPLAGLNPQIPGDIARNISDAEKAISHLNRETRPELMPLARLLLRTESIASSKVEGMQVDARALARAEASQENGRSVGTNAAEILGNIDAMQLAIERASSLDGIQLQDLIDIHEALLKRAPGSPIAGCLRTSQNWIGGNDYNPWGADFVPPPPEEVRRLLEDLCHFCNDDTLPVLVQAAIAHAQFETIHPFADGNGRTGRALIHIILRQRGLAPTFVPPISVILAREKEKYIEGLTLFREDRIPEWLGIFASAANRSAGLAITYAAQAAELQERWRQKLRAHSNPRADAAAWAIIEVLPGHPFITVPVAVAATKRTRPAVTNAAAELEAAGILRRISESPRSRTWEADGLVDLIAALDAGAG